MITVDDPRRYRSLRPVEKLLALVFAIVARDRATGLRFDYYPDPPAARLWYCVAGVPYEMVPPPGHIWPEVFRRLWRQTRLDPADRPPWWRRLRRTAFPDAPAGGTLTVRYGNVPVDFDILFFRGSVGEHIQLQTTSPPDVAHLATEFLSRCLAKRTGPDEIIPL